METREAEIGTLRALLSEALAERQTKFAAAREAEGWCGEGALKRTLRRRAGHQGFEKTMMKPKAMATKGR